MLLYKAKVRLQGSLNNEVMLDAVTAPEIAILQRVHGRDAVIDVVKVGEVKKRTDRSERNRLAVLYSVGPSADGKSRLSGETFVDSVLGVGSALAKEYVAPVDEKAEDFVPEEKEEVVLDAAEPEEAIVRTVVPAKKAEAEEEDLTA